MIELIRLLKAYSITNYEITDRHYGNSLNYGPLKMLIIYDRFVHLPEDFARLGYGVVSRTTILPAK